MNKLIALCAPILGGGLLFSKYFTRNAGVYQTIRYEFEFNQLLSLPNPLFANFCMVTDKKSQLVSSVLKQFTLNERKIRAVDVEIDESGNKELIMRYMVNDVPKIVVLNGGQKIDELTPRGTTKDEIKLEVEELVDRVLNNGK